MQYTCLPPMLKAWYMAVTGILCMLLSLCRDRTSCKSTMHARTVGKIFPCPHVGRSSARRRAVSPSLRPSLPSSSSSSRNRRPSQLRSQFPPSRIELSEGLDKLLSASNRTDSNAAFARSLARFTGRRAYLYLRLLQCKLLDNNLVAVRLRHFEREASWTELLQSYVTVRHEIHDPLFYNSGTIDVRFVQQFMAT